MNKYFMKICTSLKKYDIIKYNKIVRRSCIVLRTFFVYFKIYFMTKFIIILISKKKKIQLGLTYFNDDVDD